MHQGVPHRRSPGATRKHWGAMAAAEAVQMGGRKRAGGRRAGTRSQPEAQPRRANSNLPSGTRAQGSVLSGRGESSGHNGAAAEGAHGRGAPKERRMGAKKERGPGGGPGGASGPRRWGGPGDQEGWDGPASQAGQEATAAAHGGGRRQAPAPAQQPAWQPARPLKLPGPAGSPQGQQRRTQCALPGGHPSPGTPVCAGGTTRGGGTSLQGGPSQPAVAGARRGDTCIAYVGAGGSSACSQAGRQLAAGRGQAGAGPEEGKE